jgi:elongation factor G
MRPVAQCSAGDICSVAKLASAETGDTVSSKDEPLLVAPWELPEPQHAVALEAVTRADEDKLGTALQRLVAEDPTVRLERQQETGQILLWTVGEAHAEVLLDRLRTRYTVDVKPVEVKVALRETLSGSASVTGRHV